MHTEIQHRQGMYFTAHIQKNRDEDAAAYHLALDGDALSPRTTMRGPEARHRMIRKKEKMHKDFLPPLSGQEEASRPRA